MIINKTQKFIFISIPKTASTSIMTVLEPESVHQKPEIYHQTISELIKENDNLKNYDLIAVFRCPFSRIVSTYYDAVYDKNHVSLQEVAKYKSFQDFVKDLPRTKLHEKVRHLWLQKKFIDNYEILNLKKKFFYFEDMSEIRRHISTLIKNGINKKILSIRKIMFKPLPHHRKTSNMRPPLHKIYDIDSVLLVHLIYREDFELLPRYKDELSKLVLKIIIYNFINRIKQKFYLDIRSILNKSNKL